MTHRFGKFGALPVAWKVLIHRFIKFGTVGFSGTLINLAMLYVNQEYTFRAVDSRAIRLHLSLAGAILVATISNFFWNRAWTWQDRKGKTGHSVAVQLGQYFLASGVAIGIQYVCTIFLSAVIHYMAANLVSIVTAAVFTYVLNDLWTFAVRKTAGSGKGEGETRGLEDTIPEAAPGSERESERAGLD